MNKKGYFFFFEWGTDTKQEHLSGVNLDFKCPCKSKTFNLIFNFKRQHILFFIPISSWSIENAYIQCQKCGRIWEIEGSDEKVQDLYAEVKAKQELLAEGKIKSSNKKQPFDFRTIPLFAEFSNKSKSPEEEKMDQEEAKRVEEEENKDFIRFLKWIGIFAGVITLLILIWKFIIT